MAPRKTKNPTAKRRPGHQPEYDRAAVAAEICQRISGGETLSQICREPGKPAHSTFCLWVLEEAEIADNYARARESRADVRADRIDGYREMMIRGEIDANVCRVAIDAEKWQAGKEQPKRYGEKLDLHVGGKLEIDQRQRDAAVAAAIGGTVTASSKPIDSNGAKGK